MEWRRVKNIIIVILLLVNGFLLVLVGTRRSQARQYEESALERTIQVLAQDGIELSPQSISGQTGRQAGTLERSVDLEGQAASALLGETVEGSNRGGGLYIYSTGRGQISFRTGGELSADLADHPCWETDDPEAHAAGLMDGLKIESELVSSEISDGSGRVVYRQLLDGAPLFSCQLIFTYEEGRLTDLEGDLLTVEKVVTESSVVLTLPTVLMRFLDAVLNSGDVCSAILVVEPGYLTVQSFSDTTRLRPVWYISTNTADYYVDGITGEVTRVTE